MSIASQLYCRVEVPKGSPLTVGDIRPGALCPADWCYFPDTISATGAPLHAVVCASRPGPAGARVRVRPVALARASHERGRAEVVLCVAAGDPAFSGVERADDLPARLREEIEQLIAGGDRAAPPAAKVGWSPREEALDAIDDAAARWAAKVNGHG